MNIQYLVGLYDGSGPRAVEVLESDAGGARIRTLDTDDIFRVRRSEQLFETFDVAKSALLEFQLLQIEFAETRLAAIRRRMRELLLLQEPDHGN